LSGTTRDELTLLIQAALAGDMAAEDQLCVTIYDELHQVARHLVRRQQSMSASSLVHDVYLKMFRREGLKKAPNRKYFFAVALDQMRKLLIDRHRKRKRLKAGGNRQQQPFDEVFDQILDDFVDRNGCHVEALEEALDRLRSASERQFNVVIHRFYGGLTGHQTADLLGVSVGTVERDWRLARAKLYSYLHETPD
jgi:RNA polymerase sigma factor (TIGR02999 family)